MDALMSSSMKILTNTALPLKTELLGKPGIHFLPLNKPLAKISFSLNRNAVPPITSSPETMVSHQVPMSFKTAETGIEAIRPLKTVQVRFQLQRECLFGEQFLLVGDNSIIGSWDPSSAIPLGWSEGHIWTATLGIPIEESIQFKFILRRNTGEIMWQPGPDRIFKTFETNNTIVISEHWENAEFQKVVKEELTVNEELKMIAEKVNKDLVFPEDKSMFNGSKEIINGKYITYTKEEGLPLVNENREDSFGFEKEDDMSKNNSRGTEVKNLFGYEDGPVLVSGLTPSQPVSAESSIADAAVDARDQNMP